MKLLQAIKKTLKEDAEVLTIANLKEVLFGVWLFLPVPIVAVYLMFSVHFLFALLIMLGWPWLRFWIGVRENMESSVGGN